MAQPLRLEVFEALETPDSPVFLVPEQIEEIRLNAYERGYVAGWDDGGAQSEGDETKQRATIARQVEQLTFSYHDARAHVLRAIEPLFAAIFETVIPVAARSSIVPLVIEQLLPMAHAAAEMPITLRIAEGSRQAYEVAFEGLILPPLNLVEADTLAEGQAEFSFEATETRIDLTHAADTIRRAVNRFYQIQFEETESA